MSSMFTIDAKLEDLNQHGVVIPILFQILNAQAQPIHIKSATRDELVIGLRVNLNKQQSERLIIKPLREYLTGYTVTPDYAARMLKLERQAIVNKKSTRKPVKAAEPDASTGVADIPQRTPVVEPVV